MKSSLISLTWIAFLMVACSGQATPTIYLPAEQSAPNVGATPTTPTSPQEAAETDHPLPTPSPDCSSNLLYLEDITVPDGTQIRPQETIDKRWLVQNDGTCNWDRRFSLRLIAGSEMDASPDIALFPARSGRQVEIQIQFVAPQEPGLHRSAWQAADPEGNLFGDTIFIEIEVISP